MATQVLMTRSPTVDGSAQGVDYAAWFSRAIWLGVVANGLLAIPAIFAPNAMLALVSQPLVLEAPVWPAFAGLLLALLSVFYIPGAIDPVRYRATAVLSVLARLAGVLFFFGLWPDRYPAFGALDLVMFLIQCPLLLLMIRRNP